MAGHRRDTGKPDRATRRKSYWDQQFASAMTAEEQFAVASRQLRAVASHLPPARAAALLNSASRDLVDRADEARAS